MNERNMTDVLVQMLLGIHVTAVVIAGILMSLFVGMLLFSQSIKVSTVRMLGVIFLLLVILIYVAGGWWYVTYYPADRNVILSGPLPIAHEMGMESNEHILLLGVWLGLALAVVMIGFPSQIATDNQYRKALIVLDSTFIAGFIILDILGGFIAAGVKVGLVIMGGG